MSEYQIGRLLLTPQTKRWSQEQRDKADAIERTMIFKNFSSADDGRSRQLIARCVSPEAANELVDLIESLQQENAALRAELELVSNELLHPNDVIDTLKAELEATKQRESGLFTQLVEMNSELEAVKNENVQIRDNFQEVFSDNLKLDKELKVAMRERNDAIRASINDMNKVAKLEAELASLEAQEPVAKIIRNSAGQISMHNMEGDYFDLSKYVGETLYIKAAPVEIDVKEFKEGQWWVGELDGLQTKYALSDDEKRAIAVVHNCLKTIHAAPKEMK